MNFSQQVELFNPGLAQPVTVIGAGSVGSQVVRMLAKLGCRDITVWDGDAVESHNIPMSAYRIADLGRHKVEALRSLVQEESGVEIQVCTRMYVGERLRNSVVCCVDTMAARKLIFEQVQNNPLVDIFVDTRTAAKFFEVYSVRPRERGEVTNYMSRLYPDATTLRQTCGQHGIITVAAMTAAVAVNKLTNAWEGRKNSWYFGFQVGNFIAV